MIVTLWDSVESVQAFVGPDWEQAVVPEEERPVLVDSFVAPLRGVRHRRGLAAGQLPASAPGGPDGGGGGGARSAGFDGSSLSRALSTTTTRPRSSRTKVPAGFFEAPPRAMLAERLPALSLEGDGPRRQARGRWSSRPFGTCRPSARACSDVRP